MGVVKHKDVFTARHVTAIISDGNDRGYFVPIKNTIGDFFITELNKNFYAFTLEGARVITYREFLTRSVKWINYDTSHYRSLQKYYKELELMLKKNMLPKMNRVQLAALRILGRKERYQANGNEITVKKYDMMKELNLLKDTIAKENAELELHGTLPEDKVYKFKPYEIKLLLDDIGRQSENFPEEAENMINYLESLGIDHIVTPVGKLSDSLQDDLITTKASFLGELIPIIQRALGSRRSISNKPITGKLPWLKLMLIGMVLVGIVSLIAIGINNHWFDSITSMFSSTAESFKGISVPTSGAKASAANACTDAALQSRYTPEELKIAVQSGAETCKLSAEMQKMVDNVQVTITPIEP